MAQRVAIFGAGGHGRDTLEVFAACNRARPGSWEVVGFLSEVAEEHGRDVNGLRVLGGWEWLAGQHGVRLVCAIGDSPARARLTARARGLGVEFATVVHPTAVVPERVELGCGVIVSAGVLMTNRIRIGDHALINLGVTIAHDVELGELVTVAPGVNLPGHVRVGAGCDLGTGASLLPRVRIGPWSIVGAGAVVTADLPPNVTAVGVPARVIKTRPEGWQGG